MCWKLVSAVLLAILSASPAAAEKRIALVVGNSAYQSVPRLDNPKNDALLVANTLGKLGFSLVGGGAQVDLDKSRFDSVVQSFGNQLMGADVALFYYAGHGLQLRGTNYLVPITANPTRETDVDFQMVDVALVLRQMEEPAPSLILSFWMLAGITRSPDEVFVLPTAAWPKSVRPKAHSSRMQPNPGTSPWMAMTDTAHIPGRSLKRCKSRGSMSCRPSIRLD